MPCRISKVSIAVPDVIKLKIANIVPECMQDLIASLNLRDEFHIERLGVLVVTRIVVAREEVDKKEWGDIDFIAYSIECKFKEEHG